MSFKVQILYLDNKKFPNRTIKTGLTEKEAQIICGNKEASYKTCTKPHLIRRTKEKGPWFLSYTEV